MNVPFSFLFFFTYDFTIKLLKFTFRLLRRTTTRYKENNRQILRSYLFHRPCSPYAEFFEKQTFLTPMPFPLGIRGSEILVFSKTCSLSLWIIPNKAPLVKVYWFHRLPSNWLLIYNATTGSVLWKRYL